MADRQDPHAPPAFRSEGRLLKLRLKRSAAARADAMATLRPLPNGWWQVRVGGPLRGRMERHPSQRAAREAVDRHYNARLAEFILARPRVRPGGDHE